jgi:hypothetical protein
MDGKAMSLYAAAVILVVICAVWVGVDARERGLGRSNPPPGWYRDPDGRDVQRWWDGQAWTEHTS